MKFSLFLSCIRWFAHIEQSFPVKICAEIFYHAAIIIVLKPAMPWRTCMQHPSVEKEVNLVKSVIFLVKRCLYLYFLHSIILFSLSFLELYAMYLLRALVAVTLYWFSSLYLGKFHEKHKKTFHSRCPIFRWGSWEWIVIPYVYMSIIHSLCIILI
jgi:hypothetical protein